MLNFVADAIAEIKGLPDANRDFRLWQTCEIKLYFVASVGAKGAFSGTAEWCGIAVSKRLKCHSVRSVGVAGASLSMSSMKCAKNIRTFSSLPVSRHTHA